jgi:hypothetical protein
MKRSFLMILLVLFCMQTRSQKITYSDFQKGYLDLFGLQLIAKYNDEILVYTGFSEISYFDKEMQLKKKIELPFPYDITGIHFLAYDDYFYMFYQYVSKRNVFCMAVKIGTDGKIIGDPIEMDRTPKIAAYIKETQIYSVLPSENKAYLVAFKVNYVPDTGSVLTCISFDENLHRVTRFSGILSRDLALHFSEYCLDNEGNLLFTGESSGSWKNEKGTNAFLYRLGWGMGTLSIHSLLAPGIYTDQLRLFLDNSGKKCLVGFYYSNSWGGFIKGLNLFCLSTSTDSILWINQVLNSDTINSAKSKKTAGALNNYYIQHIRFRHDGGFLVEAEELNDFSNSYAERWNRLDLIPERVAEDFAFYNPYEIDRYYPWSEWRHTSLRFMISGGNTLFISFNPQGSIEWENKININQMEKFHGILGYKSFVSQDIVYLLFNQTIRNKVFLTVQSINASGNINADGHYKEDMGLKDTYNDYNYFPRFAKQLSPNELIVPCRKGGEPCLIKIEF